MRIGRSINTDFIAVAAGGTTAQASSPRLIVAWGYNYYGNAMSAPNSGFVAVAAGRSLLAWPTSIVAGTELLRADKCSRPITDYRGCRGESLSWPQGTGSIVMGTEHLGRPMSLCQTLVSCRGWHRPYFGVKTDGSVVG